MTLRSGLTLIGLAIAAMPYLGFPGTYKDMFYVGAGLMIVAAIQIASIRRDMAKHRMVESQMQEELRAQEESVLEMDEEEEPIKIARDTNDKKAKV
jgi:hypothetical protein